MATSKVIFTEEVVKIPTYQEGKTENLPMFAENRVHQRTSGNPFPNKVVLETYETRDFRTMQLLDWFVKEQGEEEKNASDMITKMELFGTDTKGLYMLNSELKARIYVAPSLML